MNPVSLIPYVCGAGASTPGSERGAVYCQEHGLTEKLAMRGIPALWAADAGMHWNGPYGLTAHQHLLPHGTAERREMVLWHCQALAENVATELRAGNRVVTIGGDHSMAAGSIAGVQMALGPEARIGVIWVDAHPDLHTFESSVSKALHGMPMATLLGLDNTLGVPNLHAPVIRPENMLYIGLRDIDAGEMENAAKIGVKLLPMDELRQRNIANVVQDAVTKLAVTCDHIVLSIDLDGFSTDYAPAVGTPVPGGFTPDEILPLLAGIVRAYSVPLIDIVEFNPTLPGAEQTYAFIIEILEALLPAEDQRN